MKKLYPVLFTLILFFGGMAAGALAQDAAPQADAPQVIDAPTLNPIGTAISYQGQLRNVSGPVNGVCDMTFQLFDGVVLGNAIAAPVATQVTVTNGLFVTALDFGAAAFNGEARWLEISVKCAGDPGFTTLTPRQAIAPAPYALALSGLRTEQSEITPNVIGGSVSNTVETGRRGAVIGGGGNASYPNVVTGDYSVVGGGMDNQAGLPAEETGQTLYDVVGGGYSNTASGGWATVSGGSGNVANANASTISGGFGNTASGFRAVVGGGFDNAATAPYSTVPGGHSALASHRGEMAYASARFTAAGDAQTSVYVLMGSVRTDLTSGELFLGYGPSLELSRLTISNTRTLAFDILIVARSTTGESSAWRYQGVIENNGGVTAFIGTPTKTVIGEDDIIWDVDLIADDTNDALVIRGFTNQSSDNVRFVATVRTVEVAW